MRSGYKFESKRSPNGHARQYQCQYDNAKWCAKERGIEWQFTYDTWIEWWGDDIANRGPRKGQLVMGRIGDIGPYNPDNVYKSTSSDNCRLSAVRSRKDKDLEQQRIAAYKITCAKRKEIA